MRTSEDRYKETLILCTIAKELGLIIADYNQAYYNQFIPRQAFSLNRMFHRCGRRADRSDYTASLIQYPIESCSWTHLQFKSVHREYGVYIASRDSKLHVSNIEKNQYFDLGDPNAFTDVVNLTRSMLIEG